MLIFSISLLAGGSQFGFFVGFIAIILLVYVYMYVSNEIASLRDVLRRASQKDFSKRFVPITKGGLSEIGVLANLLLDELEKTVEKRRIREREFLTILNAITSPVFIVDGEGLLIVKNSACDRLFRKLDEEAGHYYYELIPFDALNSFIDRAIHGEVEVKDSININNSTFDTQAFPFKSREELFFLFLLEDVSERKKFSEMQRSFITSVTHEIRTPLSVISGSCEILSGERLKREERRNLLNLIKANAERINVLVTKMAELSALREYSKPLEEVVNLKEVAQVVFEKYEELAKQKKLELLMEAEEVYVLGDGFLLEELMSNLVDNAIKYTSQGNVRLSVEGNGMAKITVSDTGEGMSEDLMKRLFVAFERGETSRSRTNYGLGIGLSIVKRIAELHKGKVKVTSVLYKGTTMEVEIPSVKKD